MNKKLLILLITILFFNFAGAGNISINWIYPIDNINVSQNNFFNITTNVSCSDGDCGEVNVTLDPSSFFILGNGSSTGSTSASYTLPAGASIYLCGGGDGYGAVSITSWISDSVSHSSYAKVGHQTSNICSDSSSNTAIVVGGVAVMNSTPYAVKTYNSSSGISSFNYNYNLSAPADVVILVACGWYKCNSITVPSNCTRSFFTTGSDNYETIFAANCTQNSGNYSINGTLSGSGGVAIGVYIFNSSVNLKSGLISTSEGVTPFYTNITNPYNLTLSDGQSQLITWWVNATGTINSAHEFFVYTNLTSTPSISNQTSKLNITIKDFTPPAINLTYPLNTTYNTNISAINYTYSDFNGIGYCWYSNNNGLTNSTPVNSSTNFTNIPSLEGSNTWKLYCNDSSGNENSASVIFIKETPYIDVNLISPTANINATQNQTFSVSVNVSCVGGNCGEINVTLDPEFSLTLSVNASKQTYSYGSTCSNSGTSTNFYAIRTYSGTEYSGVSYYNLTGKVNSTITITKAEVCYSTYTTNSPGVYNIWVINMSALTCPNTPIAASLISNNINKSQISDTTSNKFHCFDITNYISNFVQAGNVNLYIALAGNRSDTQTTNYWGFNGVSTNYIPYLNITYSIGKGTISTIAGTTPFFTTTTNPYNLTLNRGQSQVIIWNVNSTGNTNSTYEFFVYANQTEDSANNLTAKWNVTIVNFTVDYDAPVVTAGYPLDNSGADENVSFSYAVFDSSNVTECSLIFEGETNQTNFSVEKGSTQYFVLNKLEVGNYEWSVNCTDEFGNVGNTETRRIGIVKKSRFEEIGTNLSQSDLNNITNFVIGVAEYGVINFSESVNLSVGADIDNYVNISFNKIEIDSSSLPSLNKSARLKIYNLTFNNPQILRDGEVCSSVICTKESYSGGSLIFDVTGFSIYSSRETPTTAEQSSSSGSSGGGGTVTYECVKDSNCKKDYFCYNHKCVKLFDAEILNISAIIEDYKFELSYLIKGMADFSNDVVIDFWIENSTEKILLGKDTIYLGKFEEKTKTTKLNLPINLGDGVYDLHFQVSYENYSAESFRKISVKILKINKEQSESTKKITANHSFNLIWILLAIAVFIIFCWLFQPRNHFYAFLLRIKNRHLIYNNKKINLIQSNKTFYLKNLKNQLKNILARIKIPNLKLKKKIHLGKNVFLGSLIGKEIFSSGGNRIGVVEKIILLENKVYGWVIQPDRKYSFNKNILIKQENVLAIGDIFIADGKLENLGEE